MAEVKVSDLPVSTACDGAAIFVCDVDGVTSTVTRDVLLTSDGAENIALTGFSGANVLITTNGNVIIKPSNSQGFGVTQAGTSNPQIVCDGNGAVTITAQAGTALTLEGGAGGIIQVWTDGSITINPYPGTALHLHYTPLDPSYWSGAPTEVWEALDRIAAVVSASGASPIP